MNGTAMASFQSAAEVPDRDDDRDDRPVVRCADCGALLGSYPMGVYADCEECGGFTLSQWVPEPEGPSDEDIAARETAWAEASLREHLSEERTRADAAEAECARVTTERDAARAEAAGLRAIVEGRTRAPTDAEIAAHAAAGGAWLLQDASCDVERVSAQRARVAAARTRSSVTTHQRWWAIDRDDRPCPWPTVAAEAATGAALAGEGR